MKCCIFRQEVALEVLSYHTAATTEETNAVLAQIASEEEGESGGSIGGGTGGGGGGGGGGKGGRKVKTRHRQHYQESLRDFQFSDFDQSDVDTVKLALNMFKDFKVTCMVQNFDSKSQLL